MKNHAFALGVATAALLAVGACNSSNNNGSGANNEPKAQTSAAAKLAGNKTIASGLPANGKFMAAAKAAGLDQTLAGPGPYTVFVPDDQAFASGGALEPTPANRAQITGTLTNLILPGTVMIADIDKSIDAAKGKATLATMAGGTITATKEAGKTVISDSSGHKATVTQGDEQFTNGVVHHVDAVLVPSKLPAANAPAVGKKARK